jgi:hypothetical protein
MDAETQTLEHQTLEQQEISEGVGPYYHRVYHVTLVTDFENAKRTMREVQTNIDLFSPAILARFEKTCGGADCLQVGDEFQIHITGPWNGPVRVTEVTEDHFAFVTLQGHMEAGEIHFRVRRLDETRTRFEIESFARSKDGLVDLVYDKLPIAKFAQTLMWKKFCKAFAERCSLGQAAREAAREAEQIEVITERRDEKTGKWERLEERD